LGNVCDLRLFVYKCCFTQALSIAGSYNSHQQCRHLLWWYWKHSSNQGFICESY